jgi:hypothetical protein
MKHIFKIQNPMLWKNQLMRKQLISIGRISNEIFLLIEKFRILVIHREVDEQRIIFLGMRMEQEN